MCQQLFSKQCSLESFHVSLCQNFSFIFKYFHTVNFEACVRQHNWGLRDASQSGKLVGQGPSALKEKSHKSFSSDFANSWWTCVLKTQIFVFTSNQLESPYGFLVNFEFVKSSQFSSIFFLLFKLHIRINLSFPAFFSFFLNYVSVHIYSRIMYFKVAQNGMKHLNLHCYNLFSFLVIFLQAQNLAF